MRASAIRASTSSTCLATPASGAERITSTRQSPSSDPTSSAVDGASVYARVFVMSAVIRTRGASAVATAATAAMPASTRPAAMRPRPAIDAGSAAREAATAAASRNHALAAMKNRRSPVSKRPSRKSSSRRSGSSAKPTNAAPPERSAGALRASAIHVSQRKTVTRYDATWFPTSAETRMPEAR